MDLSILSIQLKHAAKENHEHSLSSGRVLQTNWRAIEVLSKRVLRICTFECMVNETEAGYLIITDDKRREFEVLLACYTAGLRVSEISIMEGAYSQACCLLRQDIESLTHLINVLKNTRKEKKSPHIGGLELQMKKIYSDLCEVAHLTADEVLRSFSATNYHHPADRITLPMGADCLPCFKKDICRVLLGIRILTMICITGVLEKYIKIYFPHLAMTLDTMNELKSIYQDLCEDIPELCEHPLDFDVIF